MSSYPTKNRGFFTACALVLLGLGGVGGGPSRVASAAGTPDFGAPQPTAQDIKPQDVINWEAFRAIEGEDLGVTVDLRMQAVGQDWKVYAKNLKFTGPSGFTVNKITPPPAKRFLDPIANEEVDVYPGGEFAIALTGAPRWTAATFPVTITYVGCTNTICLFPYSQVIDVPFTPSQTVGLSFKVGGSDQEAALVPGKASDTDLETRLAQKLGKGGSLGLLMLIVFVGGILSNLTPCVAPMVPITLRLLARQGARPYVNATAYALGIVICYTALGLVAALSGGLFGSLLASKAFNIGFAVVMILLALTMIGFGDLSRIQNLGNRFGSGKPSPFNAFMMGMGAGLVAAPCTGPILAALLAYTARSGSSVAASTALLSVYSCGFALPYIVLGGAASHVSKIKVSPLVQLSVKLLFGSVMLALGFYYLRIPFYDLAQSLKPHWREIALVGLILGALISPIILLSKSLQNNKLATLLPALLLGAGIFGSWQWVTTAVDNDQAAIDHLEWLQTEDAAFAAAKSRGKPILIDLWAEWCEACKKMDVTTFADSDVRAELKGKWVLLHLDMTESNATTDGIQQRYGVQSLPTLILLPPGAQLDLKEAINGYVSAPSLLSSLRQYAHK